jgi:hypothetical protein
MSPNFQKFYFKYLPFILIVLLMLSINLNSKANLRSKQTDRILFSSQCLISFYYTPCIVKQEFKLILNPTTISRIINGFEVQPHSIPFQILMLLNGRFQCGGSLISSRFVLTAAHCVVGVTATSLTIVVGEHNQVNLYI